MISPLDHTLRRPLLLCLLAALTFGAGCAELDRDREREDDRDVPVIIDDAPAINDDGDTGEVGLDVIAVTGAGTVNGRLYSQFTHMYGKDLNGRALEFGFARLTDTTGKARTLRVSMTLQGYSTTISQDVELSPGGTQDVYMSPVFDLEKIYNVTSEVRSNFEVVVSERNAPVVTLNTPITLQPINRFTWFSQDSDGKLTDLRPFVLTMAIPNDRDGAVEQLLREAAMYLPDGNIPTPDSIGEDWSIHMANAVYNAIQARGIFYSNITGSFF